MGCSANQIHLVTETELKVKMNATNERIENVDRPLQLSSLKFEMLGTSNWL